MFILTDIHVNFIITLHFFSHTNETLTKHTSAICVGININVLNIVIMPEICQISTDDMGYVWSGGCFNMYVLLSSKNLCVIFVHKNEIKVA